ncbi:MAG: hypothetical protein IIU04_08455, partial [Bacteroidales bacterium]|nr:hypothetical protein [Bacteroidales bacterium]
QYFGLFFGECFRKSISALIIAYKKRGCKRKETKKPDKLLFFFAFFREVDLREGKCYTITISLSFNDPGKERGPYGTE